ncbi:pyruvate, water dikinase regulatory protein [Wolbachia endosymbiont of Pentidionis agamae]|uniref:pyruvate, water dikinase regulatory protein n=1 Tax=Wolbachia endosymbiont of Pentidionis agamae TaxID=3110435 RepID=UPI002FD3D2AD
MTYKTLNLHLVSDSSGETVVAVAKAALKHFSSVEVVEYVWSFINQKEQIRNVLEKIKSKSNERNFVICTVTDDKIREYLKNGCAILKVPYVAILSHIMREISSYLNIQKDSNLNLHTEINYEYFRRIEAINYTINHDDGQSTWDIDETDVVLIGVSRTSKSPTSMYLAYRGYKVANVPFIYSIPLNIDINKMKDKLVVGLTIDIARLIEIRKSRLISINDKNNNLYVNYEKVEREIKEASYFFFRNKWPIIDVTQKSIEEIAAMIIQLFNKIQPSKAEILV